MMLTQSVWLADHRGTLERESWVGKGTGILRLAPIGINMPRRKVAHESTKEPSLAHAARLGSPDGKEPTNTRIDDAGATCMADADELTAPIYAKQKVWGRRRG
ncbi:MAG: hypothetical protein ACJAYX_001983 [Planctomycetota bacterium]|jgi:hypothetical protein